MGGRAENSPNRITSEPRTPPGTSPPHTPLTSPESPSTPPTLSLLPPPPPPLIPPLQTPPPLLSPRPPPSFIKDMFDALSPLSPLSPLSQSSTARFKPVSKLLSVTIPKYKYSAGWPDCEQEPYQNYDEEHFIITNLERYFPPSDYEASYLPPTTSHYAPPSPSARLVGAGVDNLGNTCFMGSILQCFTHTVPLIWALRCCNHACGMGGFCVICALHDHVENSLTLSGGTVIPTNIFDNLDYFSSTFEKSAQQDAHEFMQCALNRLRARFPHGEHNLVDNIFGGRLVSILRCCNCGHSSDTHEPLIDLSLEIEGVDTLQHALESFTKVEKIDEKLTCTSCGEDVFMEKQLLLDRTPCIAAFHLKRFKTDGSTTRKINSHVQFTLELDLQPYTYGDGNDNNVPLKYDLYAVVVHKGSSNHSGHYFCYIRSAPDKWHKFDDSQVTSVSEDVVLLSREAYILFYARQGTPWFSSIMETENSGSSSLAGEKQDYDDKEDDFPMEANNEFDWDCGDRAYSSIMETENSGPSSLAGEKHDSDEEEDDVPMEANNEFDRDCGERASSSITETEKSDPKSVADFKQDSNVKQVDDDPMEANNEFDREGECASSGIMETEKSNPKSVADVKHDPNDKKVDDPTEAND